MATASLSLVIAKSVLAFRWTRFNASMTLRPTSAATSPSVGPGAASQASPEAASGIVPGIGRWTLLGDYRRREKALARAASARRCAIDRRSRLATFFRRLAVFFKNAGAKT